MENSNDYHEMGLRSLKRAAKKVYEDAKKYNIKVPIWRNNRVEYIDPSSENIIDDRSLNTD